MDRRNRDLRMEEEARRNDDDSAAPLAADQQSPCLLRRSCYAAASRWNRRAPSAASSPSSKKAYPPISSIPKTSPERLALASADADNPSASAKTVLYLAYGSNLSAETFLGMRGIRPISQINVSAPAFDLAFNLPGVPYLEPCFANTRPRKIPKPEPPIPGKPPLPPPKWPPQSPSTQASTESSSLLQPSLPPSGPKWSKGLYGVVYEVTHEDYATIIKTEGGGQGYRDVMTPCFELPPAIRVPEKPPGGLPDLPKPFLAHTLYAPSLPNMPDDDDDDDNDDDSRQGYGEGHDDGGDDKAFLERKAREESRKMPSFLKRLLLPVHRPDEDYAQPSARYLNLIRTGAREHSLPEDYQTYLASLQPYTITRCRQYVGRFLLLAFVFVPLLLPWLVLGRLVADAEGRNPRWVGLGTTAAMNLAWIVYDVVFEPWFGDGERTMSDDDDDDDNDDEEVEYTFKENYGRKSEKSNGRRKGNRNRSRSGVLSTDGTEAEKNRLLSDW